jgi:hypothetical protein
LIDVSEFAGWFFDFDNHRVPVCTPREKIDEAVRRPVFLAQDS